MIWPGGLFLLNRLTWDFLTLKHILCLNYTKYISIIMSKNVFVNKKHMENSSELHYTNNKMKY